MRPPSGTRATRGRQSPPAGWRLSVALPRQDMAAAAGLSVAHISEEWPAYGVANLTQCGPRWTLTLRLPGCRVRDVLDLACLERTTDRRPGVSRAGGVRGWPLRRFRALYWEGSKTNHLVLNQHRTCSRRLRDTGTVTPLTMRRRTGRAPGVADGIRAIRGSAVGRSHALAHRPGNGRAIWRGGCAT